MRHRCRDQIATIFRAAALAAAFPAALALGGCSSDSASSAGGSSSFAELFKSSPGAFPQSGTPAATQTAAAKTPAFDPANCPPVDVRAGTSTLTINASSRDPATAGLRYQGSIVETARECSVAGNALTIKVGVQGRIILGPAGGPGQIEVPLRLALVQEGPNPKTIWTRFYSIPVTIPDATPHVAFTHIEEDLTVPRPDAEALAAYVVYVGFDTLAAQQQQKRRPGRRSGTPRS